MKHRPSTPQLAPQICWAVVSLQLVVPLLAGAAAETAPEDRAGASNSAPSLVESTNTAAKVLESTNAPDRIVEATNGVARLDQSSFRMISDRNIFNPSRTSRSSRGKSETEPRKVIKVESVSLVGTMSSEKGELAFFDGSGSEFKKVVKAEETIVGFTVQQIAFSQVSLVREGKTLTLPVGGKLRRQDGGPWEVAGSAEKSSAEKASTEGSATSSEEAATDDATSGDGGESDALKRLLKRREQENKNEK